MSSDNQFTDASAMESTVPLASAEVRAAFRLAADNAPGGVESRGDVIDCYQLVEPLGKGGFGTVWLAEQKEPVNRQVALKIISRDGNSEEIIARFAQERQALAMMDHPNIAKVFDAGTTPVGRPFFVMELVRGVAITKFCDEQRLSLAQRLALFIDVCHAVQHAHQKGVIHRDLKPSNILVSSHDGRPVPKVIDFGIAKAADKAGFADLAVETMAGMFLGTPVYMSPEQAAMTGDIDTRSDIYALGVLLYELLTSSLPFDQQTLLAAGFDGMRRIILEVEPPLPSNRLSTLTQEELRHAAQHRHTELRRLTGEVRGELDWIVMKCLEKERVRRYENASGLAQDIGHYLAHEPVSAAAPSVSYKVLKFLRRNRGTVAAAATIAILLITGTFVSTWQAYRATLAEREVRSREKRIADFLLESAQSQMASGGDPRKAMFACYHVLERADPDSSASRRAQLLMSRAALAVGEIFVHDSPVLTATTFDGTARQIFTMTEGPRFSKWEVASRRPLPIEKVSPQSGKRVPVSVAGENVLAYHQQSGLCATTGSKPSMVNLRLAETGALTAALRHEATLVATVMQENDQTELIEGAEDAVVEKIKGKNIIGQVRRLELPVSRAAFSPDGSRLLTHVPRQFVQVWDTSSGRLIANTGGAGVLWFQTSPTGSYFVTSEQNTKLRFWDIATAAPLGAPVSLQPGVGQIEFSPDGKMFATNSQSGSAQLWNAETRAPVGPALDQTSYNQITQFSPDSRILYLGTRRNTIAAWNTASLVLEGETVPQGGPIFSMRQIPSERAIMTAGNDHTARVMPDPAPAIQSYKHGKEVGSISFNANGQVMLTSSEDGFMRIWELDMQKKKVGIQRKIKGSVDGTVLCAALSPDGTRAACGDASGEVCLWNILTGDPVGKHIKHDQLVRSLVFSPDGRHLLTGSFDGTASLWSAETGLPTGLKLEHGTNIAAVDYSRDGRLIVTAGGQASRRGGQSVRLWNALTGEEILLASPIHHEAIAWVAKFSPDGARILTGSNDHTARLWDVRTGGPLGKPMPHEAEVTDVDFDPSGELLLTVSKDRRARLWDASTCEMVGAPFLHPAALSAGAFVPGQPVMATGGEDGSMQFIKYGTPAPETDLQRLLLWIEVRTGLHEDERGLIQPLSQSAWQQRVTELGLAP